MKKFNYRMQSILEIKYKLEDQEKTNYSIAKMKLNEEEEKLNALLHRRNQYEESLCMRMNETLNIIEIKRLQDGIESLKVFIKIQALQVKKAEQAVELAVAKLNLAMKDRKIQEKLREQAFETYLKDIELEERKEVDELVSFSYGKVEPDN
ncbi:flagellar export protein FliJ [Clostridium sp. Marseille-P299]|uniref:flagellar export protein FliJ n=1 Tax=Clostridium sp. Marseille-P299 TaxID=1805477 RepID=UPI00082C9B32|nr:flagellar export protein FliJ [Clostridium sp. Marseille-P299]